MQNAFVSELEQLGLSPAEAQIYTTLLKNGSMGASAIAHLTEIQRSNIYPILWSLADKGLVEGGIGYGGKFTASLPDEALPGLITREKESLEQRELLATQLGRRMKSFASLSESASADLIEVIRHPKVVGERFERLQLQAEKSIDVFVKPPVFVRAGNPIQEQVLRRGVRCRGLYEKGTLDAPSIKSLRVWIGRGEQARVYPGQLPHKLAIFDSETVLMPLTRPGEQTKTVLIRHAQLAETLTVAFNHFWDHAERIGRAGKSIERRKVVTSGKRDPVISGIKANRNGQQRSRDGTSRKL
jgi:sugar-specific transcriptional regulator TrmB